MKLDLEKASLLSVVALLALAIALVVRGGGYGIAELSWDTQLQVTRSNLRIGPYTVIEGDRIHMIHSRVVHRDSDLRGVLRRLETDDIWLELERPNYEVAVPLTPEAIEAQDLPAVLEGPYQVVRIDDLAIEADMNLTLMAAWMRMNGDRPAVFTVRVPDYLLQGTAERVKRPGPIMPLVVLLIALAMVSLAYWRGRAEMMTRPREHWHLLAVSLAAGGVLLSYLSWPEGYMADPVLLPAGLLALALARPLSLFVHQARLGRLHDASATYFRLGAGLPAAIFAMAAVYGWSRTLSDPLDGFVFDQLHVLVLVGAGLATLYHLADLGLQAYERRRRGVTERTRPSPPWIATVVATLFIVSGLVDLSTDPEAFALGGFVPHLAGLIGVQWLGDMALLPRRTSGADLQPRGWEGPTLVDLLVRARADLGLAEPAFACRFARGAVVLALREASAEEDEPPPPPTLAPEPMVEPLEGLLELLDAEGGMIPRYKTVRGTHASDLDPFDGLDRTVGVELVLPLSEPEGAPAQATRMQAYLISRVDDPAAATVPTAEALETWQGAFSAYPETWSRLQARAAEDALTMSSSLPAAVPEVVVAPALSSAQRALLHYAALDVDRSHPIHEPDLLSPEELAEIDALAGSRGAILISGPLGSGREFTARSLHLRSGRPGAFILLDCAALPAALVMAELAGESEIPGRVHAAESGVLCIRELGRLDDVVQAEVMAVIKDSDVRLILIETAQGPLDEAALSDPVRRAVDEAILYRPPLAERPDAVKRAAVYYLHEYAMRLSRVVTGYEDDALDWLSRQPWPANFESLRVCVLEAAATAPGPIIRLRDLAADDDPLGLDTEDLSSLLETVEREAVTRALERSDGNKSRAARLLGMKRTTYIRKLAKYAPDA